MAKIIPRWEWRAFGPRFPAPQRTPSPSCRPGGSQESDELYLLAAAGDNVKVRDDLMDIKVLREVDADGLERWEPVMKAAFPLRDGRRVRACSRRSASRLPRSPGTRTPSTSSSPSSAATGRGRAPGRGPQAARPLHDRRLHGRGRRRGGGRPSHADDRDRVGGCGRRRRGRPRRSASAATSTRATRAASRRSSTPSPTRYAVIDVGTNSVKFHVGERDADGTWRTIVDRAEVTRLGEGLEEQRARSPSEPLERTVGGDRGHGRRGEAATARWRSPPSARPACGSPRTATRSSTAIRARTGVTVEVIPGEEEGRLAYLAVKAGLGLGRAARWSSSTPAAAARSSPSGEGRASTSASASRSAPFATRSSSGSPGR